MNIFSKNTVLSIFMLIVWLLSLSGFINTCLDNNNYDKIMSGLWLIFITIVMKFVVVHFYRTRIQIPNKDVLDYEEKYQDLKNRTCELEEYEDVKNRTCELEEEYNTISQKYDKISILLEEKEQCSWYRDYKLEMDRFKRAEKEAEKERWEHEKIKHLLTQQIAELKNSRLEIVESLANLEGFKGINALVNNMIKNQVENKHNNVL
jgi:hypothetical protein